jgi:N-acyl amino acid synthase of PEP-CTERM/exosortase system
MMEPRLARSLSFIGIPFQQIGPVIEYHGQRAPYYLDGKNVRDSLSAGYKKLLLTVEKEILKDPNTYLHPFLKR